MGPRKKKKFLHSERRNKGCHLEGREVIHISMFDWEREVATRDYHLSQP